MTRWPFPIVPPKYNDIPWYLVLVAYIVFLVFDVIEWIGLHEFNFSGELYVRKNETYDI